MKWVQPRFTALCAGALVATAATVLAQPKDKGHEGAAAAAHSGMAHASDQAHEAREAAAAKADPKHGAKPDEADHGKGADEAAEHGKGMGMGGGSIEERIAKMRETRKDRRHAHSEALKQKWGDELARPDVREAIKVHEWRMARLNRVRTLVDASDRPNKDKTLAKIDKLIEKENARFDKKMDKLKTAPAPGSSAAEPAAAPKPGASAAAPAKAKMPPVPKATPAAPTGGAQ
jgi:hypothetical protein